MVRLHARSGAPSTRHDGAARLPGSGPAPVEAAGQGVKTESRSGTVKRWHNAAPREILREVDSVVSFLIAEDDELVGRILVRTLSEHGRTELVSTVEEARTALKAQSFSALVVDVGLPDGSGIEVITDARAQDPFMSALVVSGRVDERRLAEAHHLGVSFLLKPVDTRELGIFAVRTRAKIRARQEKIAALVERWVVEYDLTGAEAAVLELAAHGAQRSRLPDLRGVAASTVKKQVQMILTKTGESSLEGCVSRLLRAVVDEG